MLIEGRAVLKSGGRSVAGELSRLWGRSRARAEDRDEVREGGRRQKTGHV